MKKIALVLLLFIPIFANAKEIVFEGHPLKKIETNEISSSTNLIAGKQSEEFKVLIVKDGENYYWASRNNVQVLPIQAGAYITYLAVNGSGYIRIINPAFLEGLKKLAKSEQEVKFIYVEHLINQLGSITYYGK